jgi:hypothetical protein
VKNQSNVGVSSGIGSNSERLAPVVIARLTRWQGTRDFAVSAMTNAYNTTKSKVLCDTCKHKEYCPRWPKTVIECDMYKRDTAIVEEAK